MPDKLKETAPISKILTIATEYQAGVKSFINLILSASNSGCTIDFKVGVKNFSKELSEFPK